jgi:hypothetical protein
VRYLLSLPERLLRSTLGLGAGVAREVGELALPPAVRGGQLYQNVVDTTLRFLIQRVGGVEGAYPDEKAIADDFLMRRTAGNGLEAIGIVAFRASPVWVLAALADVCGAGRHLVPEIAAALQSEGLLEKGAQFSTVDQVLDGLERTSARLAATINTPPLDVPTLRQELAAIREEARSLAPASLPSADTVRGLWARLEEESRRHDRTVFETSSVLAASAVQRIPDNVRWLSASARVGAGRTGQIVLTLLLDHYSDTLDEIRTTGFVAFAQQQLRVYAMAALDQFSPRRVTLTEKLMDKVEEWRARRQTQRSNHIQR